VGFLQAPSSSFLDRFSPSPLSEKLLLILQDPG
jgi:hypothetical protein